MVGVFVYQGVWQGADGIYGGVGGYLGEGWIAEVCDSDT